MSEKENATSSGSSSNVKEARQDKADSAAAEVGSVAEAAELQLRTTAERSQSSFPAAMDEIYTQIEMKKKLKKKKTKAKILGIW